MGRGGLLAGDLVTSMPLTIAGATAHGVGCNPEIAGGFAEHMPLAERMLLPLPEGMHPAHAALVEPMAVGLHAVARAGVAPEDVALVIGCGPVGLAVIAALKLKGIAPIIAADFSPARRALALRVGADAAVDPALASPYTALTDAITPAGSDPGCIPWPTATAPEGSPGANVTGQMSRLARTLT